MDAGESIALLCRVIELPRMVSHPKLPMGPGNMADTDVVEPARKPRAPRPAGAGKGTPNRATKKAASRAGKKNETPRRGIKYDWDVIRVDYIEGIAESDDEDVRTFPTLEAVAQKHHVPIQRVRERSAQERWVEQKHTFQRKLATTRTNKRIAKLANEAVDFDGKALTAAKLGMAMVTARIGEIAREVQQHQAIKEKAMRDAENGYPVELGDLSTVISAKELNTLGQAALSWQMLGMKALGTDIQRHEVTGEIDVDVEVTSIAREMSRDDPERLAAFLVAAQRSGLFDAVKEIDAIEEAIVVEENKEAV